MAINSAPSTHHQPQYRRVKRGGGRNMPGGHPHCNGTSRETDPKHYIKKCGEVKSSHATAPVRLFVKGVFMGYRRGQRTQDENTALIKLQNVNCKGDTEFYLGKKLVYVYRGKKADRYGNKYRTIWGKVTRAHGSTGTVRAKFKKNLPPAAMGRRVRCMLYPSRV